MIATLCFLVAVLTIAYLEAGTDADRIAEHKPIDHGKELKERVIAVLVCGALICLSFNAWEWRTLYWLPMAWGLFTMSFRWWLNRKRGLNPWYLAWSNNYDIFWLRLIVNLRRAGTAAYAFEALVFAASFTAYTLTNN